jgi:probable HAF family extracellular repeat protein
VSHPSNAIARLCAVAVIVLSAIVAVDARPTTALAYRVHVLSFEGFMRGMNTRGQIVGHTDGGPIQAFIWDQKHGMQLLEPLGGRGIADFNPNLAINDRGQATGATTVPGGAFHAFVRSRRGEMQDLGAFSPVDESVGTALNDRGHVVGQSAGRAGPRPFLWTPETGMLDLGGSPSSVPRDINNRGQIAGWIDNEAVIWTDVGVWQELGILGVDPIFGRHFSAAYALNDRGWVVGYSTAPEGGAFLWTPRTGMQNLGVIQSANGFQHFSEAIDINERGTILGMSRSLVSLPPDDGDDEPVFELHPFVWTSRTGMLDLNTLISPSPWQIVEVIAINDRDDILANAVHPTLPRRYAVLEATSRKATKP